MQVPAVRAEACRTLSALCRKGKEGEGHEQISEKQIQSDGQEIVKVQESVRVDRTSGGANIGVDVGLEGGVAEERVAGPGSGVGQVVSTLRERLLAEDDPVVLHELTSALQELGMSMHQEDPLLVIVRSKMQEIGSTEAVTHSVLQVDRTNMTDYIIMRPLVHPTTRDYFNKEQR